LTVILQRTVGAGASSQTRNVMTEASIWVGLLDLDGSEPVRGVSGPVGDRHGLARIMIRMHRAPVGYVELPATPANSLTERAASLAERVLAEPLRRHEELDKAALDTSDPDGWLAAVSCPHRFATSAGAGMTIIVCTRDRVAGLRGCLRSLQQVSYEPLEILVVDNAPTTDGTRELVTALADGDARIRYTCEPQPGLSRARNHGLAQARYELVAFTDDDTRVDPGWPAAIAAGFAADPEAVCVTGLVASSSLDTSSERYFDSRYSWGEAFDARRYDLVANRYPSALYPYSVGVIGTGANFAFRRGTVNDLGGFDPILGAGGPGRGGEDLDMFLQVLLSGGRICYLPSSLVWHQHRADIAALSEQIYAYGYGLGAYLSKNLLNGKMPAVLLSRGVRHLGVVMGRTRQASQASQMRAGGRRLLLTEARGVLAGALRYRLASRAAGKT
jgi:glycosyltransferase involved in cell wall biosynthesis